METILVTGGMGYIGSHTVLELCKRKYKVIIIDNLVNSHKDTLIKINNFINQKVIFYECDINQESKINEIFLKHDIKSVIHFASLKSVSESVLKPKLYYRNNVLGAQVILNYIKKFKINNFVFSSTAAVYGNASDPPFTEDSPVFPLNPYAENKRDIENLLINDCYFQTNCSVKILRYFNPVGAHKSGIIGELPKGKPNNLMPYIINVALKKFNYLKIYGNDYNTKDGTGVRDYIHINDLVAGHILSLGFTQKGISIFNLGTGIGYSVIDIVNCFMRVNNIEIPYKFYPRRPGDTDTIFANPQKAVNQLKFSTKYSIDEMCKDSWNFAKNNIKQ